MANKPFEIQGATLRIGGVDLEAGNTGVVIPGVTQATSYKVEEVEDTGDQTASFTNIPTVIDYTTFMDWSVTNGSSNRADYIVEALDDEGYIDGLEVFNDGGSYTSSENGNHDMYACDPIKINNVTGGPSGTIATSTYYGFGPELQATDMTGWAVFVNGVDTGATILIQDNTYNNGTQTSLMFDIQFEAAQFGVWGFSPVGFPFASFSSSDWTQIPFRPRMRAGDVESVDSGNQLVEPDSGNTLAVMTTGDVILDGEGPGGVDRGLVWKYGENNDGINSMVRQDEDGLTVRAWTEDGGGANNGYAAPVNIVTNQDMAQKTWRFDGDGVLTFPDGTTQSTAGGLSPHLVINEDDTLTLQSELLLAQLNNGMIAVASGNYNYNIEFQAATGDQYGNLYAVGVNWDNGNRPFVMAFNPDGTSKWAKEFSYDNNLGDTPWLYNIKYVPIENAPVPPYLAIGYDCSNSTGIFNIDAETGDNVLFSATLTQADNANIDQYCIQDDGSGNQFIGGRAYGEYQVYENITAQTGTGVGVLAFNLSDIGNPAEFSDNGQWMIDDTGGATWQWPTGFCSVVGAPVSAVNGIGTGKTVNVRYYRSGGKWYYNGIDQNAAGQDYVDGDFVYVAGSALDGVDSTKIYVPSGDYTVQTVGNTTVVTFSAITTPSITSLTQDFQMWTTSLSGSWSGPWMLESAVTVDGDNYSIAFQTPDWPLAGNLLFVDVVNGNDFVGIYGSGWMNYNWNQNASTDLKVRLYLGVTDFTTSPTWNLRQILQSQGIVSKLNNWTVTFGDGGYQEVRSIAVNTNRGEVYALTNYDSKQYLLVLDFNNGSLLNQRFVGSTVSGNGYGGTVLSQGDYVYVIGSNSNDAGVVTKLDMNGNMDVVWQRVHDQNEEFNNYPVGAIASDGNIVISGSFYETVNENDRVIPFWKLNADTGAVMYKTMMVDRGEDRGFREYNDQQCQQFNIVNGSMYWAGYIDDDQVNYDIGVAVKVKDDGTGFGLYGRWEYKANEDNIDWLDNTEDANVTEPEFSLTNTLTVNTGTADLSYNDLSQNSTVTYLSEVVGTTAPKLIFEDNSELSTTGIRRHSVHHGNGDNLILSADMNGTFLYYDNNTADSNSTIIIPANADVALPIGYTVTVVMRDFGSYSIYVNNNENGNIAINASGNSTWDNWYWGFGGDGNPGIYTIMKVDTNAWMLAGPNVWVD